MDDVASTVHVTLTAGTVSAVLGGVAVALRIVARRLSKSPLLADDWWIVASIALCWMVGSLLVWGLRSLGEESPQEIDRQDPHSDYTSHTSYLKSMYITSVLYYSVVATTKISILSLYRRTFPVHPFKRNVLLVMSVVVLWWIAGTLADVLSCIPAELLWDPSRDGRCFNFNLFWLIMGVLETAIDIIILMLPIRMIMNLQMSTKNRFILAGIFSLGGFAIITGILRVVYAYDPGSMNVAFSGAELWATVHVGTGIICACLSTYRPLVLRITSSANPFAKRCKIISGSWLSRGSSRPLRSNTSMTSTKGTSEISSYSMTSGAKKTRAADGGSPDSPLPNEAHHKGHLRTTTCEAYPVKCATVGSDESSSPSIDFENKNSVRSTVDMV